MSDAAFAPTVVFVHGIFSSGSTFSEMKAAFERRGHFTQCLTFDYDYNQGLAENGLHLAAFLEEAPGDVVLVGHSMGGLVGRLAVLTGMTPQVRRLIMLGTPNFGAIRTASAGLLAQLVLQTTGRLSAVFRCPGILELTRLPRIMKGPIAQGEPAARNVEYITIPGLYFNESRESFDFGEWTGTPASTRLFSSLGIGMELATQLVPFWAPKVERPHDGIVEERSNALVPDEAGRRTEKRRAIVEPDHWGYTYAHISIEECDDLNHVTLHQNPAIISLVADLAAAASLQDWWQRLTPEERLRLSVTPTPPTALA